MRFVAVAVAALVAVGVAAAAPKDVYKAAIVAASSQHSVHYVSTSALSGDSQTIVGDAALDRGLQRITYRHGSTTGHVSVLVVANTAYVKGDAFTLVNYMGLTKAQAARLDRKWWYVKPPSGAYHVVAEAVRMGSFVTELIMPAPFTAIPATTFAGKRVTGVRSRITHGSETATLSLYVAPGSPLPVGQVTEGSQGKITTTLTRWNEKVVVAAPKGALAFR